MPRPHRPARRHPRHRGIAQRLRPRSIAALPRCARSTRPAVGHQHLQPGLRRRGPRAGIDPADARLDLVRGQVAKPTQEVVQPIGRAGGTLLDQRLQLQLQFRQRVSVEQLTQLLRPQELTQQVAVKRQRLRPPVQQGRVALVHVGGDVVEEQRGREGRSARGLDADDADLSPLDGAREPRAARQDRRRRSAPRDRFPG